MRIDGIPNEVWKYGREGIEEWIWKFCNRVWKRDGWPGKWKEGVIVPIVKRGERKGMENYKSVTLMLTLYKIYTIVLAKRLREEVEGRNMIPPNQTGFRKGLGTTNNIYVLNCLINRQLEKKERKLIALFVDLKAAFDMVDREVMIRAVKEREGKGGIDKKYAGDSKREQR